MKRLIVFATMFVSLLSVACAQESEPELEFVLQLNVTLGESYGVGQTPHGIRHIIPITGGTFEGPNIKGEILAGGADYQLINTQLNRTELEAIYCIRTHDGVNIHVRNTGIIAPQTSGAYFYTSPKFEAPVGSAYEWLNNGIYVCRPSGGMQNGICLKVWKIRDAYDFRNIVAPIPGIPDAIRQPAQKQGRIETVWYDTERNGKKLHKHARVYVPYGYNKRDKKKRYNVIYLMHGGGDNSLSFLTPPQNWLPLSQVLDHLIAEGQMEPVLVVTPTFYDDDENIGVNRMEHAIDLTRHFHWELEHSLIPVVERQYNTYLQKTDSASIAATRGHRAFGGFSMGALTTWFQLAYGNDVVRNFLPLSGDCWVYNEKNEKQPADVAAAWLVKQLEASPVGKDFQIYGYSGTDDIAGTPQTQLVEALSKHPEMFHYGQPDENLRFSLRQGGQHFYGHINEYLYHALPLIWPKATAE
ncbi:MAG: DUF3237 family protein [Bacteroidaceae bacterium]|nr:DUF3237 family protein [Bacteroidaceae bacterium]